MSGISLLLESVSFERKHAWKVDNCTLLSSICSNTIYYNPIILVSFMPITLNVFRMYAALMDTVREDISALTLLAEVLCLLDMIVNSFAHTISTKPVDRYSRPELTGS